MAEIILWERLSAAIRTISTIHRSPLTIYAFYAFNDLTNQVIN